MVKIRKAIFGLLFTAIFILSSCTAFNQGILDKTATAQPKPTSTNAAIPTTTNTPAPTPTYTPVPILFRDDFEGSLADGWKWVRESKDYWSLSKTPGWLHLDLMDGSIFDANIRNLLMYPAPEGNFEIETKIRFKPTSDFQNAGIFIYQSNVSFVHFNRAYCDQAQCVHDGLYFDSGDNNNWSSNNYTTALPDSDIVYLRLRRENQTYSAFYSMDGQNWTLVGTQTNSMAPTFVGIEAGQSKQSITAEFDYFQIIDIP